MSPILAAALEKINNPTTTSTATTVAAAMAFNGGTSNIQAQTTTVSSESCIVRYCIEATKSFAYPASCAPYHSDPFQRMHPRQLKRWQLKQLVQLKLLPHPQRPLLWANSFLVLLILPLVWYCSHLMCSSFSHSYYNIRKDWRDYNHYKYDDDNDNNGKQKFLFQSH